MEEDNVVFCREWFPDGTTTDPASYLKEGEECRPEMPEEVREFIEATTDAAILLDQVAHWQQSRSAGETAARLWEEIERVEGIFRP